MNKKHYPAIIVLIVFLIFKIYSLLVSHDLWWDSSVYIGIGKYIFSLGKSGLWEASRPLVWPIILGLFWKLGLPVVLFGKIAVIFFSTGTGVLTYLIGMKIFDRNVALISTIFVCFSETFFLFNNILFSGIVSTFFFLLSFYLYLGKNYKMAGLFAGISIMTRFFQILILIPLFLFMIYKVYKNKEKTNMLISFFVWFLVPVVVYLLFNLYMYKNMFYPFVLQAFLTKFTGLLYHEPFYFYFVSLLKENFLVIFSFVGLFSILKKKEDNQILSSLLFLFPFVLFVFENHKEMRFLIPIMPFLYFLTTKGIVSFTGIFKKKKKILLILIMLIWVVFSVPNLRLDRYDDELDFFYENMPEEGADKEIWISNPSMIVYSDYRAKELMYYPTFNHAKFLELESKIDSADMVLLNTCDLYCEPYNDFCENDKNKLVNLIGMKMLIYKFEDRNACRKYIFISS